MKNDKALVELLASKFPPLGCAKDTIIEKIAAGGVCELSLKDDKSSLMIETIGVEWYGVELSRDDIEKLIHELMALHEQMSD